MRISPLAEYGSGHFEEVLAALSNQPVGAFEF
jgi:hypothetical protein